MARAATIAYRNPDGSFRNQQMLRSQDAEDDLIRKAAEVLLPAFEAFLCEMERGDKDGQDQSGH